ncbi:squalene monooxygenase-like [Amphiura filiformis]|uniref:squalene monooxygenase-like n=1 Tax=Amphiura filiformis TaxID=82378 RepID=UPI003B217A9D
MEGFLIGIGIVAATIAIIAIYRFASARPAQVQHTETKSKSCNFSTNDPEIVIIGAGIAGASLAAVLGKGGRRVVMIERDMSQPPSTDFKGEGLQPGGMRTLLDMGLNGVVKDLKGMPFAGLVVSDYETGLKTKITYSQVGMITRHWNIVQPLRKHAQAEPTVELIEGVVTELVKDNGRVTGVKYREKDSQDVKLKRAPLTVISDGPYSKFRKVSPNVPDSETESYIIGIELRNVQHPDPSYAEVRIGSPLVQTITYRVDDTTSRVLIAFRNKPDNTAQFLETKVVPNLPDFIQIPAQETLKRQSYFKCLQCKRTPASNDNLPGVLILGEAFNSRDQMGASGMSVALNDVKFWQRALSDIPDLSDDEAFLKQKELFMKQRKSYSWTINMTSHIVNVLGAERQSSSVKLRHALMRNTKDLEKGVPREIQQAAYDLFSLLNVDEGLLRTLMYNTCRDAVLQCITWRSLIQPWKTVQDIYGIITKYRSIISADV